jgi:hypothetical protein
MEKRILNGTQITVRALTLNRRRSEKRPDIGADAVLARSLIPEIKPLANKTLA